MQKLVVAESVEGKYGPQIKDVANDYYSFSKFYKGPTVFEPGTVLDVDVYKTEKGGKYLNKAVILAVETNYAAPAPKVEKKVPSKPLKATKVVKATETMTKADWNAKDRSQLIGGLSHDAATLAAVLVNVNSLDTKGSLEVYKELLEGMLLIREQVK